MSRKSFLYSIDSFRPPMEGDKFQLGHSWGLSTSLDRELAKRAMQTPFPEKSSLIEICRGIVRCYGFKESNLFAPLYFERDNDKATSFVQVFSVPGNRCELAVDGHGMEELRKADNELTYNWVEYSSHNVDTLQQASALLSLFTFWANTIGNVLGMRYTKR